MAYQRGSGFVGLQQYLNANQQQAATLGGSVAGRIEGQQGEVRSAADATLGDVQQAAAAGTPTYTDPVDMATAENRAAGVGTTYTGPQGLTSGQWNNLTGKADAVGKNAQYGTTDAGVATLLQQQYGNGYTGVGGRSLDSFLARRGAGERLDSAAGKGMEALRSYLNTTNERAIAAGEQGSMNAANVRGQYRDWANAHQPQPAQPTQPLVSLPPTTQPYSPGNTLGTIHVPGNTPRQTNPVTIGNTTVGAPKPPGKGGGRYVGGQWVPYT